MLLNVFGIEGGTLILGDYGIWYLLFGIWFEIWNWLMESGIRCDIFRSVWSHYGTAILSPVHCAGTILISREDTDSAGRILIAYLFGWWVWYRAVSSTEQGGCCLRLRKTRRRCQFRIFREFQWWLGFAIVFCRMLCGMRLCAATPARPTARLPTRSLTPSSSVLYVSGSSYMIYICLLYTSPSPRD